MARCQIKKGLFVVRECGGFAAHTCKECGKYTCSQHGTKEDDGIICGECYAKRDRERRKEEGVHRYYDDYYFDNNLFYTYLWYDSYRYSFYNEYNYSPFDSSDYDSFDDSVMEEFDDNTDEGGFFDS